MASTRRFEFGPCLGRGSFGEVYAASMRSPGGLETSVAVKLLRGDLDLKGDAVRRLRDEGRLLARLNHPAIVKVYDLVTLKGRLALITELVDGRDLANLVGEIPVRPLLQTMGQIASALQAACDAEDEGVPLKLVHRDVKPSNIRLEKHGQAKLLDFGIARFDATDREVRTASDMVVGSVPFMAPERFIERGVLPSSDVFSVGCTLYEGITGRRFYGTNQVAKVTGLALHPERYTLMLKERLEGLDVHRAVIELLSETLAHDPTARPPASEVAELLEEIADALRGPTLRMWCRDRAWPTPESLDGPLEGQVLEEQELEAFTPVPVKRTPVPMGMPVVHERAAETSELEVPDREVGVTLAPPSEEVVRLTSETPEFPSSFSDLLPPAQRPTLILEESAQQTQQRPRPPSDPKAIPAPIASPPPDEGIGLLGWFVVVVVALALVIGGVSVLVLVPGLLFVLSGA